MKNFFRKLGFRKMDEMEQHIAFKAQRNALLFLIIALFIWTIYEAYKVFTYDTMLNPLPCFLLAGSSCVQLFSQLIMARNAVKDDDESFITSPLFKIIILVGVIVGIIATAVAAIMFMGVRA